MCLCGSEPTTAALWSFLFSICSRGSESSVCPLIINTEVTRVHTHTHTHTHTVVGATGENAPTPLIFISVNEDTRPTVTAAGPGSAETIPPGAWLLKKPVNLRLRSIHRWVFHSRYGRWRVIMRVWDLFMLAIALQQCGGCRAELKCCWVSSMRPTRLLFCSPLLQNRNICYPMTRLFRRRTLNY